MTRIGTVTLAAVAALALLPVGVQAQWGIKGGLVRSNVKVASGLGDRTGLSVGIVNNMGSGIVTFMSEALFVQKGFDVELPEGTLESTDNFADLNALLRLNIGSGPVTPIVFGGGYYSYLISNNQTLLDASGAEIASETVTADGSTTDYGWLVGAGVALTRLTIDARYTVGLKHAVNAGDLENLDDYRLVTVMVGLSF